jgi:hypothetical protein
MKLINPCQLSCNRFAFGSRYLLSSPPMFLTMFRREKTTPKINFASSSLDRAFRPPTMVSSLLTVLISDWGRAPLVELEIGRGVHLREYTHSASLVSEREEL